MWMSILKVIAKSLLGELFNRLLKVAGTTIFNALMDAETNRKAYEFVKQLHGRTDLTASEKANQFNLMMLAWAKDVGKELKDSTVNCLREFAVSVVKSEIEAALKK